MSKKPFILSFILSGLILVASAVMADNCTSGDQSCNLRLMRTRLITKDITIYVPAKNTRFCGTTPLNTIQDALHCLSRYKIANNAIVTISMQRSPNFDYDTINVNHPDGDKIHIVGDCTGDDHTYGICTIHFKPNIAGLAVENGNKLGLFDNFHLVGDVTNVNNIESNVKSGILARGNSTIKLIDPNKSDNHISLIIDHFASGLSAMDSSSIITAPPGGIELEYNAVQGFIAILNSELRIYHSIIQDNPYGGAAFRSSGVDITYSTIRNNTGYALSAQTSSGINAGNDEVSNNGSGFYAFLDSSIYAAGSTLSNKGANFSCNNFGSIFGANNQATNCGSST